MNGNATLFNNVGHVYDYENRVLQAGLIQADYRPDGKRAWKQPGDRSTRTYYVYDGGRVILEFNPANGFYQAYAYGANGLACSERQDGHMVYAFDPAGNLVHRLRNGTVLSNSWFDSYGGLLYDDSATGVKPYPSPDSVGYRGQWGAYTDVESRAYAQYLRWVFVDGDYYHPLTGTFLTRRSAGTNEYSAGVNPTINWGRVVGGTLAGIAGSILTGGNPLGAAVGVALFEGLYSATEGKSASVAVRDAVVSGALAYVGGRFLPPVETAAAQVLLRGTQKSAQTIGEWVVLYRAVEPAELTSIRMIGRFTTIRGAEVKYFTLTAEEAAWYAREAGRAWGTEYTLVKTWVSRGAIEEIVEVDRGIQAVVIRSENLPYLARPEVLDYMPIPWRFLR